MKISGNIVYNIKFVRWKYQKNLSSRFWDFVENAEFRKLQENIIVTGLRKKISSRDCNKEKQQYFHDV